MNYLKIPYSGFWTHSPPLTSPIVSHISLRFFFFWERIKVLKPLQSGILEDGRKNSTPSRRWAERKHERGEDSCMNNCKWLWDPQEMRSPRQQKTSNNKNSSRIKGNAERNVWKPRNKGTAGSRAANKNWPSTTTALKMRRKWRDPPAKEGGSSRANPFEIRKRFKGKKKVPGRHT